MVTNQLSVLGPGEDGMNDREGKLALCDILAETFITGVLGILQILVVVPNLK